MTAMRYRLRTLLIVLALGPPVLAVGWQFRPRPDDPPDWLNEYERLRVIDSLPHAVGWTR